MDILPPPGPARRRQLTQLVLLVAALAVVVWFVLLPTFSTNVTSNRTAAAGPAMSAGQLPVPDPLKLDTLRAPREAIEAGRNPFAFGQREEPSLPGTAFLLPPQPATPTGPIRPPPPSGPPAIPLRLTGLTVAERGGATMATLKDTGTDALYQAFEGDIVDGRYRVVRVGVESVVVSYLDGSGQRTLPLGG